MNLIKSTLILFGGGGGYTPAPPPPVPTGESPEMKRAAEEAAKKERDLARKRSGRRSTILTSGMGLSGEPTTQYGQLSGKKSKLGQ